MTATRVERADGPGLCSVGGCPVHQQHGVMCNQHAHQDARARGHGNRRPPRPERPAQLPPVAGKPSLYWVDLDQLAATLPPDQYPDGLCATSRLDFFATDMPDIRRVQQLCAACPDLYPCLARAVAQDEAWGVWGGTVRGERTALRRALARRPR